MSNTAKILEVTACQNGFSPDGEPINDSYQFKVYEFSNGVIMVPGETTYDWFFVDRKNIQANGMDEVGDIEDTGKTVNFSDSQLTESIENSQGCWGSDDATAKALELLAD
jgi:hypothetical protein